MGLVFKLLIEEAIRWQAGENIENKLGPTLARALYRLRVQFWGPMRHLLPGQEGGLLSDGAARIFDDCLSVARLLVGRGGSTTKGLVERCVGLAKIGMVKLKKELQSAGIGIAPGEMRQEVCMPPKFCWSIMVEHLKWH